MIKRTKQAKTGNVPGNIEALRHMAMEGWEQAKCDMFNPAVPDPIFSFSNDYKEPFYIDVQDWTVHLNLQQAPVFDEKFQDFVRSMSHHELGHYTICPYDGATNGLMFQAAQRVLGLAYGPVACNIVSDLIIEREHSKRFKGLNAWCFDQTVSRVARSMNGAEPSDTWKLIVAAESIVTGVAIPEDAKATGDFKPVMADAKKIATIVQKNLRDTNAWPDVVGKVSRILKKYVPREFHIKTTTDDIDPSSGWRDVPGEENTFIKIPVDVLGQSGDVSKTTDKDNGAMNGRSLKQSRRRKKRSRKVKDAGQEEREGNDTRILIELAKKAKSIGEFGGPAVAMGLIHKEHALAAWYRSRSAGLIRVDLKTRRDVGTMPITPDTWRIGDSIESLDLTLTLLNSPLIIPNRTTRKWDFIMQTSTEPEKHYPDFLIVIDSSGSMRWKPNAISDGAKGPYDIALVAGFAAVHFARTKGIQLAAINFSGSHRECEWTRNVGDVENILLEYEGDGTVLPTKEIIKLATANGKPVLTFIISDAGLYDWKAEMAPLTALIERGHNIVFFLIGGKADDLKQMRFVKFINEGGRIYCIKHVNDLIGLVVDEIKRVYAPVNISASITSNSSTSSIIQATQ
ncbi:MAG TPA: VWA domain-containing protein [Candidatus Lokiarchaeia archaeon]|nr:VWA domain-containing protein [Candidatus Lokiarchaeia archaeon]